MKQKGESFVDFCAQAKEAAKKIQDCQKVLTAIGDETRQHLLIEMMQMGDCHGVRVGEITRKTNLSRPAVSHHLGILKDAGLIDVRREGTKNYYYFDSDMKSIKKLIAALQAAVDVAKQLPDQEEER
ncbi:metalloregulator ArsR/SmtB family transcription factor [Gemmiger sp.]|uniref:ArsR/SmtB family transcription factor n=1 Tax=Gemmiger sp. TaxID=2049027 RepID=UPI002A91450B|nr:metalloregulator ArsR/SmtB family transcription factor [Gemmiger sp.]